jgi:hypothetical protein
MYHLDKTNACKNHNIRLLHFYDVEIDNKFDIVGSKILSAIGITPVRIFARNTTVSQPDQLQKRDFLCKNHIQGNDNSKLFFSLVYAGEICAVMTFGKRKITGSGAGWELIRYASKTNTTIVGGFSKLLTYATPHLIKYGAKMLFTYADIRLSVGNLYERTGFNHKHNSAPCYWYFKLPNNTLLHRSGFMKHKLCKKLEYYDDNKTEWQNMKDNNYDRIWDCGQMVFTKHLT